MSGSDACSVSSNCVFCLLLELVIVFLVKGIAMNTPLIMCWCDMWGGAASCSAVRRSRSSSLPLPWYQKLHKCKIFLSFRLKEAGVGYFPSQVS